ncbi:MFS transporter [Massilia sp. YMA4]|uniref:MFS transporter n=1 Tax=Massilia sp. YMA4 TaxID=1593482 RepID=UPI000DD162C9|nr:MFS transporter [Massilia sp. YMA4]AXA93739.1 MFS transporter [Massilia sp. YMA4]
MNSSISRGMVLLLAAAAGLIVANLYYAQTLVGPISAATGLSPAAAGLIVTLTQVGYTLGLLFVVPLGDLLENRRLIVTALAAAAAALLVAAFASSAAVFLAAALVIGLSSVAAQVLVPFAAHLSSEAERGHVVGKVVSGLLLGVMLARPAASLVADYANWHVVFGGAAVLIALLALVLRVRLPQRRPTAMLSYPKLIGSLWTLFTSTPVLRRRAAYHAGLFGSFSLFWTVVPLVLASPAFGLSGAEIAVFALVGMAGAVASPIAGKLADTGHGTIATAVALGLGVAGFALPLLVAGTRSVALAVLVVASIVLDMGVAGNLVLGQRAIFMLGHEVRSRLNGLYFAVFFAGGAAGSALGGWVYAQYGWHAALLAGLAMPALALLYWAGEALPFGAARKAA